jgi:hypothetical protein
VVSFTVRVTLAPVPNQRESGPQERVGRYREVLVKIWVMQHHLVAGLSSLGRHYPSFCPFHQFRPLNVLRELLSSCYHLGVLSVSHQEEGRTLGHTFYIF